MPTINDIADGSVCTPMGFQAAGVAAGIKQSKKPDVALIVADKSVEFSAAFTQNAFAAPPVVYSRDLAQRGGKARAIVVNSGNANACTGTDGARDVRQMARFTADLLEVEPDDVLVCSTGRIGVPLPMDTVQAGIRAAFDQLSDAGGLDAAKAIMTTDTVSKSRAVSIDAAVVPVHLGGMAKGAGMIAPKMALAVPEATLLSFITTDAVVAPGFLNQALATALGKSFNQITIDGDTSTNDTTILMTSARAGNVAMREGTYEAELFQEALNQLMGELAKDLVRDAEGGTKLVEVTVIGAADAADARACAEAIANSLLCKTAWFGADPNWGRLLDAAGYSGARCKPERVSVYYDKTPVVRNGMDAGTAETELAKILQQDEFRVEIDLASGSAECSMWTCDLTYDYVKINAEYRT